MFKRPQNVVIKKIMDKQYKETINKDNLSELSYFKIKNIFKNEDAMYKENYLHNLVSVWWDEQIEDEKSLKLLKRIIKRTRISLNQLDAHDLMLIEERIFSIDRHIKILEVSNKLLHKEQVGAKFVDAVIYIKKKSLVTLSEGELLLTNRRMILIGENEQSFFWKNIMEPEFNKYGFTFVSKDTTYVMRIHDQITLNNTIINLTGKKVKKWNH